MGESNWPPAPIFIHGHCDTLSVYVCVILVHVCGSATWNAPTTPQACTVVRLFVFVINTQTCWSQWFFEHTTHMKPMYVYISDQEVGDMLYLLIYPKSSLIPDQIHDLFTLMNTLLLQ